MTHDYPPSLPPIEEALHDLLSAAQHLGQAASSSTSMNMNTTIDLTQTTGGDDVDKMMPSSGHAMWPLKFVKPMSEGFLKMEMMTGGLEYWFAVAFPSAWTDEFLKASYNINWRLWDGLPKICATAILLQGTPMQGDGRILPDKWVIYMMARFLVRDRQKIERGQGTGWKWRKRRKRRKLKWN
jgi:hypothetical protein